MPNQLIQYLKGENMKKDVNLINDMVKDLENVEGYMIGVTTIKEGKLNHSFITKKFPTVDLLKSWSKVKKLIIDNLEEEAGLKEV
jgi:hypothetical protein